MFRVVDDAVRVIGIYEGRTPDYVSFESAPAMLQLPAWKKMEADMVDTACTEDIEMVKVRLMAFWKGGYFVEWVIELIDPPDDIWERLDWRKL